MVAKQPFFVLIDRATDYDLIRIIAILNETPETVR